ncbi:hypothetical protein GCM10010922_25380 [Microbacterium sorbitolivorans]|nr:hypothetical protein GCM10010922_25380 [Microbacterium sorbitolivorans]
MRHPRHAPPPAEATHNYGGIREVPPQIGAIPAARDPTARPGPYPAHRARTQTAEMTPNCGRLREVLPRHGATSAVAAQQAPLAHENQLTPHPFPRNNNFYNVYYNVVNLG